MGKLRHRAIKASWLGASEVTEREAAPVSGEAQQGKRARARFLGARSPGDTQGVGGVQDRGRPEETAAGAFLAVKG